MRLWRRGPDERWAALEVSNSTAEPATDMALVTDREPAPADNVMRPLGTGAPNRPPAIRSDRGLHGRRSMNEESERWPFRRRRHRSRRHEAVGRARGSSTRRLAACVRVAATAKTAAHRVRVMWLVPRPRRRRRRLSRAILHTCSPSSSTPWAATTPPAPIVAGAHLAAAAGTPGGARRAGRPRRVDPAPVPDLDLIEASEVIGMHDDPAQGVRRKKDSTLVRAAEAVRDGKASAMISAGNTGATMAAALLRMGRISGVKRPAVATPIPVPGSTPTDPARCGRERRGPGRLARAVRADGFGLRPPPFRHRRTPCRPAVDRGGAGQGRHRCARRPTNCSRRPMG